MRDNRANSGFVTQEVRVRGRFCGTTGQIRALSHKKYAPEPDLAGQTGNFGPCLTKGMRQSPVLRDRRAISGPVSQKVRVRGRFCGTTGQFRALSHKKYAPEPGFAGQTGKFGRCLTKSTRQSPVLRDKRAKSGLVTQKVRARVRFCGTTGQFRAPWTLWVINFQNMRIVISDDSDNN